MREQRAEPTPHMIRARLRLKHIVLRRRKSIVLSRVIMRELESRVVGTKKLTNRIRQLGFQIREIKFRVYWPGPRVPYIEHCHGNAIGETTSGKMNA
jgi:hypothetical protein